MITSNPLDQFDALKNRKNYDFKPQFVGLQKIHAVVVFMVLDMKFLHHVLAEYINIVFPKYS